MEPDESLGEDARSIAYFDMYVYFPMFPRLSTKLLFARVLQREGERGLFASGHPATASDDDADDDGYNTETDSSDGRQLGAGSATGGQSESTGHGECKSRFHSFHILYGYLLGDA